MNGWNAQASGQYKFESLDEWLLRGGPAMRMPAFTGINWIFQSNAAKRFYVGTTGTWNKGSINNFSYFNVTADISWRAWPNLLLSVQPNFMKNVDEQQYVAEVHTNTSESTWLLGKMDNRNLGFAFRVDYAITPECTIQYYGSPFVSIAKYTGFKKVIDQQAKNYYDRFVVLEPTTDGELYYFDENNDGVTEFSISNPDFNYQQFRSNLVVRWEYKTGSAIYLVWSQDKTQYQPQGSFDFHTGFENMMDIHPRNVFMIKFNYLLKL
jgi:hypothetical protein